MFDFEYKPYLIPFTKQDRERLADMRKMAVLQKKAKDNGFGLDEDIDYWEEVNRLEDKQVKWNRWADENPTAAAELLEREKAGREAEIREAQEKYRKEREERMNTLRKEEAEKREAAELAAEDAPEPPEEPVSLTKLGLGKLEEVLQLFGGRLSNIKNTRIPLEQRRNALYRAITTGYKSATKAKKIEANELITPLGKRKRK
tara:strand:- start:175 stop:780 length:606 start_codon:yes stop_codon:yes gene_type:complete